MRFFGGNNSDVLKVEIVRELLEVLDAKNELVKLFRTSRDRIEMNDVPDLRIRIYSVVGTRQYDLPTSDVIGAIVFYSGDSTRTDYDMIIEYKGGTPRRVNKLHPSYMSLQFLLLFVYGQSGYHPELRMRNMRGGGGRRKDKMTMNMFYTYQLHDRYNMFGLLSKCGRLFQQYVVTAYCSIELNRLDYVRNNQQNIRNEYLSGLYDAINRGDHYGADVGSRTILPASFTGVLYTIEFQKRGLPHCHTLLWIKPSLRSYQPQDVDRFISAELPDPDRDPDGFRVVSDMMMHGPCGLLNKKAPCMEELETTREFFVPRNSLNRSMNKRISIKMVMCITEGAIWYSKSVSDFGLPRIPQHLIDDLQNRLIMEEKNYDRETLLAEKIILESKLNSKQLMIYNLVISSNSSRKQELIFVYGHGGTGKTFLWKAITTAFRADGKIVLTMASSGIVSLLLPAGRTAHSRFKIPIDLTDESMCNIKKKCKWHHF
ncbi:uncharacterized protein [Rutidosis leptorrhynchoides]|uniref:uncharacterized protein n=1 Tax=Rutidosis leptorrhynchoides TaxID=125765 RepID=UPI003A9986CC